MTHLCQGEFEIDASLAVTWYNAPNSASAIDATINFIIIELTWNAPFKQIGSPFLGFHSMKICLHKWLHAFGSDKYAVSECTFNIMSGAWKCIFASSLCNR